MHSKIFAHALLKYTCFGGIVKIAKIGRRTTTIADMGPTFGGSQWPYRKATIQIARMLLLSRCTIRRRVEEYGLTCERWSVVTDNELDAIYERIHFTPWGHHGAVLHFRAYKIYSFYRIRRAKGSSACCH